MEYRRIAKDGISLFAGQAGAFVLGLINMMLLTRILSSEEMGRYSLFFMVVNLAVTFGFNWSDSSIVRHGREEYVKRKKINKSFWARFFLFYPIILLFTVVFAAFSSRIAEYIGISPHDIILIVGTFLFTGLSNAVMKLLQSTDQMKTASFVHAMQRFFYMIGLLLVFFRILSPGLGIVLLLINLSFILCFIYYLTRLKINLILPFEYDRAYFRKIWSYSWPQLLGFSGLYVVNNIDTFVIRKYMTLTDVGIYSVAYQGFFVISQFLMLIHTLFLPLIVEYRAKGRYDLVRSYLKKVPLFSAVWVAVACFGLLSSGIFIPLFFSERYVQAIPSFNVLLVASMFYFGSVALLPVVNAFDMILYSQIFNLVKSAANIAGDFLLVPHMGIIGAAYATAFSYCISLILTIGLLYVQKRKFLVPQNERIYDKERVRTPVL